MGVREVGADVAALAEQPGGTPRECFAKKGRARGRVGRVRPEVVGDRRSPIGQLFLIGVVPASRAPVLADRGVDGRVARGEPRTC